MLVKNEIINEMIKILNNGISPIYLFHCYIRLKETGICAIIFSKTDESFIFTSTSKTV